MKTPITPLYGLTIALLTSATLLPHADAQQILAPGPDNTTIADGESLYISNEESVSNNLDAFIIAIGWHAGQRRHAEQQLGGTLINNGTLTNNDGTLDNKRHAGPTTARCTLEQQRRHADQQRARWTNDWHAEQQLGRHADQQRRRHADQRSGTLNNNGTLNNKAARWTTTAR